MKNMIEIDGLKAVIAYHPDIGMFRGELLSLSGSSGCYADSVHGLNPHRAFPERFNLRLYPSTHEAAVIAAAANAGKPERMDK